MVKQSGRFNEKPLKELYGAVTPTDIKTDYKIIKIKFCGIDTERGK